MDLRAGLGLGSCLQIPPLESCWTRQCQEGRAEASPKARFGTAGGRRKAGVRERWCAGLAGPPQQRLPPPASVSSPNSHASIPE